jgi:hypothetical protein
MICRGRIDVVAAARARNLLGRSAEENNEVYLDKPIMVHNVYFTLLPDRSGGFRRLKDFYGNDSRIIEALEGKSLRWIAGNDPARIHKRRVEEIERSTPYNRAWYSRSAREAARKRSYSTYRSSLGAEAWPSFTDLFAD